MGDGRIVHTAACQVCHKDIEIKVRPQDVEEYQSGNSRPLQVIFDYLTPSEREMFRSGTCGKCWAAIFPPEPEEDRGEPVGWYDLPTWIKNGMDQGDEALAFAKGLQWYRLEQDAFVAYQADEFVNLFERE